MAFTCLCVQFHQLLMSVCLIAICLAQSLPTKLLRGPLVEPFVEVSGGLQQIHQDNLTAVETQSTPCRPLGKECWSGVLPPSSVSALKDRNRNMA
ncbi:hypothetical protein GGR50DRAFT_387565 [Xylaria sp. CBS 124048]|nr:hypothetical protein GGR50DRAFT_387565 [Xylaria sp. CBS 124048]